MRTIDLRQSGTLTSALAKSFRGAQLLAPFLLTAASVAVTPRSATAVSGNYADAVVASKAGELHSAARIARLLIVDPTHDNASAAAQVSAQCLSLLGQVAWREETRRPAFAERCFAWAMFQDATELTYWRHYVDARLASEGYSTFHRSLVDGSFVVYTHDGIFTSQSATGRSSLPVPFAAHISVQSARDLLLALLALERKDMSDARRRLNDIRGPDSSSCLVLQAAAFIALTRGDLSSAEHAADFALRDCEDSYTPNYIAGRALWLQQHANEAYPRLQRAISLDPAGEEAEDALVDLRRATAPTTDERIARLKEAIFHEPGAWRPWELLWHEEWALGSAGASDYLQLAKERQIARPRRGAAYAAEALASLSEGHTVASQTAIRSALLLEPENYEFAVGQLVCSTLSRDPKAIADALTAASHHNADFAAALAENGITSRSFKDRDTLSAAEMIATMDQLTLPFSRRVFAWVGYCSIPRVLPEGQRDLIQEVLKQSYRQRTEIADLTRRDSVFNVALQQQSMGLNQLRAEHGAALDRLFASDRWIDTELSELKVKDRDMHALIIDYKARQAAVNKALASQQRLLVAQVAANNARATVLLDSLSMAVAQNADALQRLGVQQQDIIALARGTAEARVTSAINLSNILSAGPSIGPFHINVFGILEALAALFGL